MVSFHVISSSYYHIHQLFDDISTLKVSSYPIRIVHDDLSRVAVAGDLLLASNFA